ncbi:hypothetical protein EBT16_07525 [bacterium]|nr:hypothetical protein [bacterium]
MPSKKQPDSPDFEESQSSADSDSDLDFSVEPEASSPENKELEVQVNHIRTQVGDNPLNSNQLDILKRYIELKETEVRDLREQQQKYQDKI